PAPRAEQSDDAGDAMTVARGLPPVISSDEMESGPVSTPESAAAPAASPVPEAVAATVADTADEPAAPAAPRRRSRPATGTDAVAPAAPRAPRSRKKPAADGAPQSDKASGE
ncbi:MAG TPA: DUF4167 domain-containing protein, partial [Paracoccus sp. (in: a-proteobacteria)]|nr:DUF4167 domain-containing protein [Paracoccus sp. (in: a-proteobacteria)]